MKPHLWMIAAALSLSIGFPCGGQELVPGRDFVPGEILILLKYESQNLASSIQKTEGAQVAACGIWAL